MTRLRPQSAGKAESLFVANLKPFSTASTRTGFRGSVGFSGRRLYGRLEVRLFWIDIGRPNHLAPFLEFVGDELAEVGGGA